jgi:hypothetical protein
MLFQLFPKNPEQIDRAGRVLGRRTVGPEKYQFDAGSPCFHDIADDPAPKDEIREKFPYLYTDLVKGLKQHSAQLETLMKEMSEDPSLSGSNEGKTKSYDINDEIKRLGRLKTLGYFTDEVRPKEIEAKPASAEEQPATPAGDIPPPQQGQPMESIRQLALEMLEEDKNPFWRETGKKEVEEADEVDEDDEMDMGGDPTQVQANGGAGMSGGLGSMGAGSGGGGQYPPGTAPTMPESFDNKGNIMENVDKDVAAMLQSLKKYDTLKESVAPVMGMVTLGEKKGGKPAWLQDAEEKAEGKEVKKSGKDSGLKAKKEDKKDEKIDETTESADQEVLTWMKRFASLGNMKGYGR